ncbi:MAG: hypothetical protein CL917_04165 [Deltaproteobacteria bacterium]|nr:hypothetical protein [Deltaproteobacteria bacterium]
MSLICDICGKEGTSRDHDNGRCSNCGSFYSGHETPREAESLNAAPEDILALPNTNTPSQSANGANKGCDTNAAVSVNNTLPENNEPSLSDSTRFIQPREISPQFQRHIERAWQATLAEPSQGFHETLNNKESNSGTHIDTSSLLKIGSREVLREAQGKNTADYCLQGFIGGGAMGKVWEAKQESLDRTVAVKYPNPELLAAGSLGETQFISEVVVTGKLEHPNIVPIYELGRDKKGQPFYAMKHVHGKSWDELISQKSLTENISILEKVCDAIAFAHAHEFLHRDIKPENIIIGEYGEVTVMDWGIAISMSKSKKQAWAAVAHGPAGTPAYMAPEMAAHNSGELGFISDVYLLGAVLYEIVTGHPPHPPNTSAREALLAAASNEIVQTNITGELIDIARHAMATSTTDRYQTVSEFQQALQNYKSHRESGILTESAEEHLSAAAASGDSDEYARARFAFEEALSLWPNNTRAKAGHHIATLAYADNALEQGNYALGLSILDSHNPSHQTLLKQLRRQQKSQRRKASLNKLLGLMILLILAGASSLFRYSLVNQKEQNKLLLENKIEIEDTNAQLEKTNKRLEDKRSEIEAKRSELEKKNKELKAKTLEAKRNSYRSLIGFGSQAIRNDNYRGARNALTTDPKAVERLTEFQHWEWGRLQHILQDNAMKSLTLVTENTRVHCLAHHDYAVRDNGKQSDKAMHVMVAGTSTGLSCWKSTQGEIEKAKSYTAVEFKGENLPVNQSVDAVAIAGNGSLLIGSVREKDNGSSIRFWDMKVTNDGQIGLEEKSMMKITSDWGMTSSLAVSRSPNGMIMLAGCEDGEVRIYRLTSSGSIQILLSPDKKTSLVDHLSQVWSINVIEPHSTIPQTQPTSTRIATASEDGSVRVWETRDWTNVARIADYTGHVGPVYAAAFVDCNRIVSAGNDKIIRMWDVPKNVEEFQANARSIIQNAIGHEVKRKSTAIIQSRDLGSHNASVHCLAVFRTNNETRIFSGGNDNVINVWDPSNNTSLPCKTLRGHGRWVQSCILTKNNQCLVSGAFDGIKTWNWRDYENPVVLASSLSTDLGKQAIELPAAGVEHFSCSPNGRWVASARSDGRIDFWDLEERKITKTQLLGGSHQFLPGSIQFFKGGKSLMTSAGDNTTLIWDTEKESQTSKLEHTGLRGLASISENGTLCLTGSDDDSRKRVRCWLRDSTASPWYYSKEFDSLISQVAGLDKVTCLALSMDAKLGLLGDENGNCLLFSIDRQRNTFTSLHFFKVHDGAVSELAFDPLTHFMYTTDKTGELIKWNFHPSGNNKPNISEYLSFESAIKSFRISQNGKKAVIALYSSDQKTLEQPANIILIDTTTLEILSSYSSGSSDNDPLQVQDLAFSHEGNSAIVLARRSDKYFIARWDFASKRLEECVFKNLGEPVSIAISPTKSGSMPTELLTFSNSYARRWSLANTSILNGAAPKATLLSTYGQPSKAIFATFDTESIQACTVGSDGRATVWSWKGMHWEQTTVISNSASKIIAAKFGLTDPERLITLEIPVQNNQIAGTSRLGILREWSTATTRKEWTATGNVIALKNIPTCFDVVETNDAHIKVIVGHDNGFSIADLVPSSLALQDKWANWKTGESVDCLAFSRNGDVLITASNTKAELWSISRTERKPFDELQGSSRISSVGISGDSLRVLTGGKDFIPRIWSVDYSEIKTVNEKLPLMALTPHSREVTTVTFSPDGKTALTSGRDGRIIIEEGEEMNLQLDVAAYREISLSRYATIAPLISVHSPSHHTFEDVVVSLSAASDVFATEVRLNPNFRNRAKWKHEEKNTESIFTAVNFSPEISDVQEILRNIQIKLQGRNSGEDETDDERNIEVKFELNGFSPANKSGGVHPTTAKVELNVNGVQEPDKTELPIRKNSEDREEKNSQAAALTSD